MAIQNYRQILQTDTEADILAISSGQMGDLAYAKDTKLSYRFDGTQWVPTDALRILRGTATVNAKNTGNTTIYTMPNTSFRFVPLAAHAEAISITGAIGVNPTISIGTNASSYNNMFSSSLLDSILNATGITKPYALTIATNVPALTASTNIVARVSGAATLYTTYTIRIDIMGYYEI